MTSFRMSVTVLAVMHALFAGFTALVSAFANGGDVWRRLLVVLLHPLGAAGVLVLVLRPSPRHDDDPRPRGTPDSERGRRPGPCAADGRGPRAGRLGAGAGLLSGSGHRSGLRAGATAHGLRNGRVRRRPELETRWSRGRQPCSVGPGRRTASAPRQRGGSWRRPCWRAAAAKPMNRSARRGRCRPNRKLAICRCQARAQARRSGLPARVVAR